MRSHEIQVRDPKGRFGAFFEDLLLSDEYYA
jgi:methionyl aminopeptidase